MNKFPLCLPHELRRKIWDNLEGNALVGNTKAGHLAGNGMPDLYWQWIREWLIKEWSTPVKASEEMPK